MNSGESGCQVSLRTMWWIMSGKAVHSVRVQQSNHSRLESPNVRIERIVSVSFAAIWNQNSNIHTHI